VNPASHRQLSLSGPRAPPFYCPQRGPQSASLAAAGRAPAARRTRNAARFEAEHVAGMTPPPPAGRLTGRAASR